MTSFGEDAAGWDAGGPVESGLGEESDSVPTGGSLGEGHEIRLNEETFRMLMKHPATVMGLEARGALIAASANSLVAMDPRAVARLSDGTPPYAAKTVNPPENKRARVYVYTNNMLGILDEKYNSTLLKAANAHPSDPIPTFDAAPAAEGGGEDGGEVEEE